MEKDIQYIDQYLREELTPEEKASFRQRLEEDESFEQLFLEILAVRQVSREDDLRQKLEFFRNLEERKSIQRRLPRRWMLIAASVLLLVAAGWWWQYSQEQNRIDRVMASYEHYPSNVLTRGPAHDQKERQNAYVLYEARKYKESLPYFENILDQGRRSDTLYYGLSLVGAREFEKGKEVLEELSAGEGDDVVKASLNLCNELLN